MRTKYMVSRIIGQAAMLAFLFTVVTSDGAPYVVTLQGSKIVGTEIRARQSGEIILITTQGQRVFQRGQYRKAYADKPSEIDRAARAMKAKKFDEAAKLLEAVVAKYRYLEWDNNARKLLPKVYEQMGAYDKAVKSYEALFKHCAECKDDEELKWAFMDAMLLAKKYDNLSGKLDEIIATDENRANAARAQIMRGDIAIAKGQLESAVLDYLRTVVFFQAEKDHMPEATFKAAETLEKLRDNRARAWYKRVAEDYPASEYAAQAREKL